MVASDFKSFLCDDGLPPLWPRPPQWVTDPALKAKLFNNHFAKAVRVSLSVFSLVTENCERQRAIDTCYRHLCHLERQQDPHEIKTADEWTQQLLPIAGFKDTGKAIGNRKKRMNVTEFVHLYRVGRRSLPSSRRLLTHMCPRFAVRVTSRASLNASAGNSSAHVRVCAMCGRTFAKCAKLSSTRTPSP
jgi:hypothetical protein